MDFIADILLFTGALAAAIYCIVLSRRLKRLNNLEGGMGSAVAVLSAQVDDMTRTLQKAQNAAGVSAKSLTDLTDRAEDSARKLELLMASLHDLPSEASTVTQSPAKSAEKSAAVDGAPVFLSKRHRSLETA